MTALLVRADQFYWKGLRGLLMVLRVLNEKKQK